MRDRNEINEMMEQWSELRDKIPDSPLGRRIDALPTMLQIELLMDIRDLLGIVTNKLLEKKK